MRILIVACLALAASAGAASAQTGSLPSPPAPAAKPATPAEAARAAKSAADATIADCVRLWDKGTHMTKGEWARTCQRIQTRLDNLKIESLDMTGAGARKKPGGAPQGSINSPSRAN